MVQTLLLMQQQLLTVEEAEVATLTQSLRLFGVGAAEVVVDALLQIAALPQVSPELMAQVLLVKEIMVGILLAQ
jgi:hypothetical protein